MTAAALQIDFWTAVPVAVGVYVLTRLILYWRGRRQDDTNHDE